MASNNKTTAKANKTANKTSAIIGAVVQAVSPSPDQQAISELTLMVRRLMAEITELKAAKVPVPVNSEIVVPANKTNVVPANKTKVNMVPANKFVLLAEGTVISESIVISSIGTPFGSKYGPRQAINCVTAQGNTYVAFINCVRDALGNAIPSGLVGGGKYVMTGTSTGKTSEFNGVKSNVIGKAKFALAS